MIIYKNVENNIELQCTMPETPDSDNSDEIKNISANVTEGVCRDYLRGLCSRQRCKYKHNKNMADEGNQIPTLMFCHDFQNNGCNRAACRFIHCSVAEEEEYKRTGGLPAHLQLDAARKHQLHLGSSLPVCKNFLYGSCRRSATCKYRHVTRAEYELEIRRMLKVPDRDRFERHNGFEQTFNRCVEPEIVPQRIVTGNGILRRTCSSPYSELTESGPPPIKRRFLVPNNNIEYLDVNNCHVLESDLDAKALQLKHFYNATPQGASLPITRLDARAILLEEENVILHKHIAELKKHVSDLTATNEFLLDQNAQLRVSSKHNQASVTSVAVPAVTITNTTVPPNNTPTQQQQVIRTVTASVATVPVSIATVTAHNPVSIAGVSMAPVQAVPAVSIAQPSAQQIIAQSQQLLANTPSQITITNNSQAQLAIAQQNLANNLAAAQQSQPITNQQLTSQAQQLATQQLTSQAQQLALANNTQQLTSQAQQLALANNTQQLTSQAQQLATQQLTSQAQQLALANNTQQLTSQAQQLALANNTQQLTSQAQQIALANSTQLTTQAQLALAASTPQLLATSQQMALTGNNQMNAAINTSQAIAMSNATQPMVSYPIMTQSVLQNGLPH